MFRTRMQVWPVLLSLVVPTLGLYGRGLVTGETFAFRDAAHFYYGQFAWEQRQWRAGQLPLWNPQENLGSAVVADPTASLFYPGKVLFWLPGRFDVHYNLYVIAHGLAAAIGAYWLARQWSCSRPAAVLGGLSYACGGNVLFLYSNVVYLVGAAWLPLAFGLIERLATRGTARTAMALAAVQAMMILGGDPQLAVHAWLIGCLRVLIAPRAGPPALPCSVELKSTIPRRRLAMLLVGCAALTLGLSAVQSWPTLVAGRSSFRAAYDNPRSVWEVGQQPASVGAAWNGLVGQPPADSHHGQLYEFSVGPWRAAELIWPNVLGKMFPVQRRWGFALPGEARLWTPSLYQGVLPILLAIGTWWGCRDARQRWLVRSAVVAVLAGCGSYGLGWLVRECCGDLSVPAPRWLGDPTGGLYWLLVVCVPGYVQFRYPAKWWTVASLAIAMLAAQGLDRLAATGVGESAGPGDDLARVRRHVARWSRGLAIVSGLALLGIVLARASGWWDDWLRAVPADPWLGPLDVRGAWQDTVVALTTTLGLAVSICAAVRALLKSQRRTLTPALCWLLVGVTALDLVAANAWMVATVPEECFRAGRVVAEELGTERFVRTDNPDELPTDWRTRGSLDRIAETVRWDARTQFGKLFLLGQAGAIESPQTTDSLDYRLLLEAARGQLDGNRGGGTPGRFSPAVLELLHVGWEIDARAAKAAAGERTQPDPRLEQFVGRAMHQRAWLVSAVRPLAGRTTRDRSQGELTAARTRMLQLLFPATGSPSWRTEAVVEPADSARDIGTAIDLRPSHLLWLRDEPRRVTLEVEVPCPALLVLADRYDPDWQVTATDAGHRELPDLRVVRTNAVCRGVWLPPGTWVVDFHYRPRWFYCGAVASGLFWLGCGLIGYRGRSRGRDHAS